MPSKKPTKKAKNKKPKQLVRSAPAKKTTNLKESKKVKLASVWELSRQGFKILWDNKQLFGFVILIYGLLYLILVQGFSSATNINSIKTELSKSSHGSFDTVFSSVGVFTYLLGTATSSTSSTGSAYQVMVIIVASMAVIWTLRQLYNGQKIRARDAYYKGLYPLAQYALVLLFIALELLPIVIGLGLYALLLQDGIAINAAEKGLSLIIVLALIFLSCYLVTASIMALYIVTLPDMTPIKALRSAKNIVKNRRLLVFRKLIFLPISVIVVMAISMLPFIYIVPVVAAWIFFILSMVGLAYIHSYCYSLYRGLINE